MIVIVGHGPSIVGRGLGPWLDQQTVVRLKWAERPNAEDWGTRTDYVCASHPSFWINRRALGYGDLPGAQFWYLSEKAKKLPKPDPSAKMRQGSPTWFDYWARFQPSVTLPKPSTGLKAIFCAVEFLAPAEIGLIGFDMVLRPDIPTHKWFHVDQRKYGYSHDAQAEHQAVQQLGIKITEL